MGGLILAISSILHIILTQVDSSPPTSGAFAVDTEHAVELDRQRDGWMTYSSSHIKLAWLGFQDPHSGIRDYHVRMGTEFHTADLFVSPKKHLISHEVILPEVSELT